MLAQLTEKLESVFKSLRGRGKLTEANIRAAFVQVRRALLEADVHYRVVKEFLAAVEARALGREVLESITPGQQVVKIVHDELVHLLGDRAHPLATAPYPPTVILVVGLQGSGKTTFCGKLAKRLAAQNWSVLLVAADRQRPAAVAQLQTLGRTVGAPVFTGAGTPVEIVQAAVAQAESQIRDYVIIDTAGRLHVDALLLAELTEMKQSLSPHEVLFVADALTGQTAVEIAQKFQSAVQLDGIVLTKFDGDARGGAALSIRAVVGTPIKFIGVGEKPDDLEVFHPDRLASRILGFGDVVSLVEKAQQAVSAEEAREAEEKILAERFTFEDFLSQLQQMKKMGPMESLLGLLPGVNPKALRGATVDEKTLGKVEAMIYSMTRAERSHPEIIDGSRRRRVAAGSGTTPSDVNGLLKQFLAMQKMVRQFKRTAGRRGSGSIFSGLGLRQR
jgi:signal recognition particle subunit SRP54